MAPKKKNKLTREEILQRKREAERQRYERVKNDPQKREEMKEKECVKYLRKKEQGTRKLVKDMSKREHRSAKKHWRKHCAKYRNKRKILSNITNQFVREDTPDTHVETDNEPEGSRERFAFNKSRRMKNKRNDKLRKKNMKQKLEEIADLKKKLAKYKKRISRLEGTKNANKVDTPSKKLNKMLDTPESRKKLVQKALFGEALKDQLKQHHSKLSSWKDKRALGQVISGKIVKKYKLWRMKDTGILTYRSVKKGSTATIQPRLNRLSDETVTNIVNFFEDDSNSRLGAEKKEFITRKKIKKQKRYLLDSLTGLYKKLKTNDNIKLSYQTFCRLRPFWVVMPKVDDRDTCLCVTHANIDAKLSALCGAKILNYSSHQKLLQNLCCDRYNTKCLSRQCELCIDKTPSYQKFDNSKPIIYKKWVVEKQKYLDPKTKRSRETRKYLKKPFTTEPHSLIEDLDQDLKEFLCHERNIVHQFDTLKLLRKNLTENDAIIHMDFSENDSTKYGEEIQAFHFGGFRMQITLHTVVVHLQNLTQSYCTVSKNNSHSPAAIWTHLQTIFDALPPQIKHLHFISDGPVTQYRNKTMFYILATKLSERLPNIRQFSWNFSESGHGKGAPDGIGATCKRTADSVVATGGDIDNLDTFVRAVAQRCPGIILNVVEDTGIQKMIAGIEQEAANIKPFKGTLQVHQVAGKVHNQPLGLKFKPVTITMRSLSCFCSDVDCKHFKIGSLNYERQSKLTVEDVYTDPESDDEAGPSSAVVKPFTNGDFILVKLPAKNKEYRYVGVIEKIDEDDGEITVTFLKIRDAKAQTFKYDSNDVADVTFDQVIEKLPVPRVELKGKRKYYKFDAPVNVFEK